MRNIVVRRDRPPPATGLAAVAGPAAVATLAIGPHDDNGATHNHNDHGEAAVILKSSAVPFFNGTQPATLPWTSNTRLRKHT